MRAGRSTKYWEWGWTMADVGSAYVTLMPSMRGFANDIKAQFGQAGNEGGKSFGSGLTTGILGGSGAAKSALSSIGGAAVTAGKLAVAGLGAVTGAVTAVGGAALNAYADYEQLSGGVETLFGSSASTLKGYADEAYRTAGMSANQYMTQATSFAASLVQSVGGDTAKAAEYANMAMIDMSDNVNKMGSDMQSVQDAYQGFAKQNFTMLDNLKLGYGGTKEEMQRLIADANKLRAEQGKTADLTIDSYADIVEAIHTVQEEMGITGTTAKEASTTISGSIGMAKAAWTNFLTGLGRDDVDFSQLTNQLLESIGAVAKNVAPRVAIIGKSIIQAFPSVLSGLGSVLVPIVSEALSTAWNIAVQALAGLGIKLPTVDSSQFMAAFQQVASFVGAAIDGIKGSVSEIVPVLAPVAAGVVAALTAIKGVQLAGSLMNTANSALYMINAFQGYQKLYGFSTALSKIAPGLSALVGPAGIAVAAIAGLTAAVVVGYNTNEEFRAAIQSAWSQIQALAAAVWPVIQQTISLAMQTIQAVVTAVWPIVQAAFTAAGAAIQAVVSAVFPFIESTITSVMNAINAVIGTVLALIKGDWEGVWSGVLNILQVVWDGMIATVQSCIQLVSSTIDSALSFIKGVWNSAWSALGSFLDSAWDGFVSAVTGGNEQVMSILGGLPGKIIGLFADAGSWLIDSGRALLQGFADGVMGAVGWVGDQISGALGTIRGLFPFSPAKEGPFSGRGYTTYSGKALMRDWAKGMASEESVVRKTVKSALGGASAMLSAGVSVTGAPAAAGAGGNVYITVDGRQVDGDQRIRRAVEVIVSAADRASSSRKGW